MMNDGIHSLFGRLKRAGLSFSQGMTSEELDWAERIFGFRFPDEIRQFLSIAVPSDPDFFSYRDTSEENRERFCTIQASIEQAFLFDLAENREDLYERLGSKLGCDMDSENFDCKVMEYLRQSVKLIPFYDHRCFFDGMDGMPIVSFWQSVDSIFYGGDLVNYLEVEFLNGQRTFEKLDERMEQTGIWKYVIDV
ncbi:MAG: hypothetical protein IJA48_00920 [Oscillospiraceae bacterium]|nr:hypothetical protein [Oscillospiraceae bacterium]